MLALIFLLFAVISFIGSLQPGPVNLGVVYYTLHQQKRKAVLLAIGGSLPEILYVVLAVKLVSFTSVKQDYIRIISILASFVLIGLGAYLWFYKASKKGSHDKPPKGSFWSGMALGLLNPQLLVFWAGIIWYLQNTFEGINLMETKYLIASAVGAGIGAFLLHVFYIGLIQKYQQFILLRWLRTHPEKSIGLILFLLGLFGILHTGFYP